MEIAVLADDLTSATDGAAPFARAGWRAEVVMPAAPLGGSPVAALDLESRCLDAVAAARRASAAAAQVASAPILYKTTDSTMRGNIAAELRAVLEASRRRVAVVAPAFPAAGRVTRGGLQLVGGVPVDQTEFRFDPCTPALESRVKLILENGGLGPVRELSSAEAANPAALAAALSRAQCVVVDAATDADLLSLLEAAPDPQSILWVGSPGLASALARRFPGPHGTMQAPRYRPRRVLVLVGSVHPVSRAQLARLRAVLPSMPVITLPDAMHINRKHEIERCSGEAVCSFSRGQHVVALASQETRGNPEQIARALGSVAGSLISSHTADGLVVTGGEIAARALAAAAVERLLLWGEVEPGIAVGELIGAAGPCAIVAKAGGFGDEDTLLRALQVLRHNLDAEKQE